MYGGLGVSAPSLHRESTDSLINDGDNCCTDFDVGNWTDGRGRAVQQGTDETTCL